jgi:hypothetical protein
MLAPTSLADALELTDAPRARWVEDVRAHADSVDGLLIDHGDDDAFGDVEAELYGDASDDASDDEEDDDEDTMQFEADEPEALRGLDEALASEAHAPAQHQVWHEQGKARIMASDPLDGIEDIAADKLPIQASLFEDVDATVHAAVKAFTVEPAPALPDDVVQRYCDELDEAQGPKPVATIEQLFKTRYTPLLEALSRGLCDQVAGAVVEDWRAAFDKSYCDAFTAIRATLKRPTMVLDAPDVATRIARLNGARAVQLLLVDSMRYDLGERVLEELKSRISHRAVCVEQTLMWSAMPTVTPTQMTLLSRGARGLREEAPKSEREAIIQRDGSVDALRRVRIGHRDLVKLDLVEARLRDAGGPFEERMAHIAGEVATVIARFSESLAPKTLLYVFGDHGFRLPVRAAGTTGPASQGGASPEEVLVGAQAWLVGDVH